jgi:hypothetical protein
MSAQPLTVAGKRKIETLSDADLMRAAVYSDSAADRSAAVLAWGSRQFNEGMKAASQVHAHVVDRAIAKQVRA